jgi:hypothetical protein
MPSVIFLLLVLARSRISAEEKPSLTFCSEAISPLDYSRPYVPNGQVDQQFCSSGSVYVRPACLSSLTSS